MCFLPVNRFRGLYRSTLRGHSRRCQKLPDPQATSPRIRRPRDSRRRSYGTRTDRHRRNGGFRGSRLPFDKKGTFHGTAPSGGHEEAGLLRWLETVFDLDRVGFLSDHAAVDNEVTAALPFMPVAEHVAVRVLEFVILSYRLI